MCVYVSVVISDPGHTESSNLTETRYERNR